MEMLAITAADKKFVNPHLWWNLFKRLSGVADGERHQNGARPWGDFVQIEPEPVREQHDFRRNGRHRFPVILAQEAQINLGKGVAFRGAAQGYYAGTCALKHRMVRGEAHELEGEVRFH